MRIGNVTDLQGNLLGRIIEQDDGTLAGEDKGASLVEQAPLKTFDDWLRTVHHSTYLRFVETDDTP